MTFHALKASLALAPQAAIMLNSRGMVVMWNQGATDLFGWSAAETEGRPAEFIAPDGQQGFGACLNSPEKWGRCHIKCRHKDGHEMALTVAMVPIPGSKSAEANCLCIILKGQHDKQETVDFQTISRSHLLAAGSRLRGPGMTERLQFESLLSAISGDFLKTRGSGLVKALQTSLNAIREFFEADLALMVYTTGKQRDKTRFFSSQAEYMNPSPEFAKDQIPYGLLQHLNRTPFFRFSHREELPPDWIQERELATRYGVSAGLWLRLPTRGRDVVFMALNQRDPGRQWSMDTAHRLKLLGEIMFGAMFRCRVEQELASAKAFQETILENLPIGVFVKNASDLKFAFMNRAARQIAGCKTHGTPEGKSNQDVFTPEDAAAFTKQDQQVLATGKMLDTDHQVFNSRTQGTKIIHTRKVPVFDDQNQPLYLVGIIEDLTQQIASSQENSQLKSRLKELQQMASVREDTSDFAHDFNNLIYGISGYTNLIKEMTTDPEIFKCLDQILVGAKRASVLINRLGSLPKQPPQTARGPLSQDLMNSHQP